MRKTIVILLATFLFILLTVTLLQIDDDLDPKAQSMYAQAMESKESKAYLYLLGMQAAIDEQPEAVGKAIMASIRKAEKKVIANPHLNQEYEFVDAPNEKRLPLFVLGTCEGDNCEYVDKLFSYPFDLETVTVEQSVLLKRYKKFIAMRDYHTLALPLVESPFPHFQYVMAGNTLVSLEAIKKAKNGNIKGAKKILLDDISSMRVQLQQADMIVAKMIYTSGISRTLDVLSMLIQKYDSRAETNIPALSIEERSLVKAMNYEYAVAHNMFKSLDKAPNLLSKDGQLPEWMVRALFKPNMTLNATFPVLRQAGQDSLLSSKAFAQKVANNQPIIKTKSNIRNYAGTVLGKIEGPNYNQYISRLFNLDAKIHLFNKMAKH
jgi:hypothetical protein